MGVGDALAVDEEEVLVETVKLGEVDPEGVRLTDHVPVRVAVVLREGEPLPVFVSESVPDREALMLGLALGV